ncbi:MAG TPA: hypothetical protein VG939_01070 [Caulobacteraceae bacterium]|nr:hypothetical protein [Caulobacteraceae bacterium]
MKIVSLAVLAAASILAATAPAVTAVAQPYGGYDRDRGHDRDRGRDEGPRSWDIERRIDWMQNRIDHGRDDGSLDRREAYRVQSQLDEIRRDFRHWQRRNGVLLPWQRDQLDSRIDRLNDQIHWLRRNDERRPWAP